MLVNPNIVRYARVGYWICAGIFALCIVLQVFFAGAAVFVAPGFWVAHRGFGQTIQWLTLVLLAIGLLGRLPRTMQWLNLALIGLFVLQYLFLLVFPQLGVPAVRALHAVNALALFWLSVYLWQRSWPLLRSQAQAPSL